MIYSSAYAAAPWSIKLAVYYLWITFSTPCSFCLFVRLWFHWASWRPSALVLSDSRASCRLWVSSTACRSLESRSHTSCSEHTLTLQCDKGKPICIYQVKCKETHGNVAHATHLASPPALVVQCTVCAPSAGPFLRLRPAPSGPAWGPERSLLPAASAASACTAAPDQCSAAAALSSATQRTQIPCLH